MPGHQNGALIAGTTGTQTNGMTGIHNGLYTGLLCTDYHDHSNMLSLVNLSQYVDSMTLSSDGGIL